MKRLITRLIIGGIVGKIAMAMAKKYKMKQAPAVRQNPAGY